MSNLAEARRRWLGMICLVIAAGMLVSGLTVLEPHLDGLNFLVYWSFCFLLTVTALLIATLDLRSLRRRARNEQRQLIEQTLRELPGSKSRKSRNDNG